MKDKIQKIKLNYSQKKEKKSNKKLIVKKIITNFFREKKICILKKNYVSGEGKIDYIVCERKKDDYSIRFIILEKLDILNYDKEFNKTRISNTYLKKKGIREAIFKYVISNGIEKEIHLDMIQIYISKKLKKLRYRKNILDIDNFINFVPLRNAA